MLSDEMTVNFDILGAFMKYRIVGYLNGIAIVSIERSMAKNRFTKFPEKAKSQITSPLLTTSIHTRLHQRI